MSTDTSPTCRCRIVTVSMPIGNEYDRWAAELAAQGSRAVELVTTSALAPSTVAAWSIDRLGEVEVGDWVPVVIEAGAYRLRRTARILELEVDFAAGLLIPKLGATA